MQTLNALAVMSALIGLAMFAVGWLICTFTALWQRRWLNVLLSLSVVLSIVAAKRQKLRYAGWLLLSGFLLFLLGILLSEWLNPRLFLFSQE